MEGYLNRSLRPFGSFSMSGYAQIILTYFASVVLSLLVVNFQILALSHTLVDALPRTPFLHCTEEEDVVVCICHILKTHTATS